MENSVVSRFPPTTLGKTSCPSFSSLNWIVPLLTLPAAKGCRFCSPESPVDLQGWGITGRETLFINDSCRLWHARGAVPSSPSELGWKLICFSGSSGQAFGYLDQCSWLWRTYRACFGKRRFPNDCVWIAHSLSRESSTRKRHWRGIIGHTDKKGTPEGSWFVPLRPTMEALKQSWRNWEGNN